MATKPDPKIIDLTMAKKNVKYKTVWQCPVCGVKVEFPKDEWAAWSAPQRKMFTDELDRQHLVHPA